jgi:ATP-dependent helicase/nuclease subunit A
VTGAGGKAARLRGTLAHRLLQSLPSIPVARREKIAGEFLARRGKKLPPDQRTALLREILRLIATKDFAEVFASGSRAEVPIVGKINETLLVSGQIDRLSVTESAVLIADFKTNRRPPSRIEEVPAAYVAQLAAYRAVLQKLYPDKPVRAALIWTEVPDLMELSADLLDRALANHVAAIAP